MGISEEIAYQDVKMNLTFSREVYKFTVSKCLGASRKRIAFARLIELQYNVPIEVSVH